MRTKRDVFLVESDAVQGNQIAALLKSSRYRVKQYPTAEDFLDNATGIVEGVMLIDCCLNGMSGLELQSNLARRGTDFPVVFISKCRDLRSAVKAMKAGAVDFLEQPFSNEELLESIKEGFSRADASKENSVWIESVRKCYDKLSGREREVIQHVAAGMSSREVGELLGISHRTVEVQRTSIMRKMEAKSLPDLVRKYSICQNTGLFRLRGGNTTKKH